MSGRRAMPQPWTAALMNHILGSGGRYSPSDQATESPKSATRGPPGLRPGRATGAGPGADPPADPLAGAAADDGGAATDETGSVVGADAVGNARIRAATVAAAAADAGTATGQRTPRARSTGRSISAKLAA